MDLMTPQILKSLLELIEKNQVQKFYWRKEWLRISKLAKERDHFECQICKQKGKHTPCRSVHHKKPVKKFPQLALNLFNLISLCEDCHNNEHNKEKYLERQLDKQRKKEYSIEKW